MDIDHPENVIGWNGSLQDLAKAVSRLRYDKVVEFVEYLAEDLYSQATTNRRNGKVILADKLLITHNKLIDAVQILKKAWRNANDSYK